MKISSNQCVFLLCNQTMKKFNLFVLFSLFLISSIFAQTSSLDTLSTDTIPVVKNKFNSIYKIKPSVDVPIVAVGTIWSSYTFTKIYNKGQSSTEKILSLRKEDINSFDRWAIYSYSKSMDKLSYYPFYAAIPLPLIYCLTSKDTRHDFLKITFLYWEALSVTGLFGTSATYFVDRYRPYAYDPNTDIEKRKGANAKNSFYSGHAQIVAVSTFFIAKVHADYHPSSKSNWIYYGVAGVATGTTAYLRLRGGQHFPSDILLGTALGTLSGILVPQFHKVKNPSLSVIPYMEEDKKGLTFIYQFHDPHKL